MARKQAFFTPLAAPKGGLYKDLLHAVRHWPTTAQRR